MLGSLALRRFVPCVLTLLVFRLGLGENRSHAARWGDVDSQRAKLLEAVKMGILSSLGMDREPRPAQKASDEELRKAYQLYRGKLQEVRGNSSQVMRGTRPITSTVLFPDTVELVKVQHRRWYRAVFQKNPDIQTELMFTQAELKISRRVLDRPISAEPKARHALKVKVDGMKPTHSAAWTQIKKRANMSSTQEAMLDISPEVGKWLRTDGGQALVVDVGIAVRKGAPEANPTISLDLGLRASRKTRVSRSNKEDDCDEQGWCCRKSLTVSFKDIGWMDWVVAPAEYTMHFCDGTCPHNYKPASMHTQVKSRLYQITKGGTPRPCCVPAAYEPMVLMHYDSRGKLKLTAFDDLIVSKCHCA